MLTKIQEVKRVWLLFNKADTPFWKKQLKIVKLYDEWENVMEQLRCLVYLIIRGVAFTEEFSDFEIPYYSVELDDFLLNLEALDRINLY